MSMIVCMHLGNKGTPHNRIGRTPNTYLCMVLDAAMVQVPVEVHEPCAQLCQRTWAAACAIIIITRTTNAVALLAALALARPAPRGSGRKPAPNGAGRANRKQQEGKAV